MRYPHNFLGFPSRPKIRWRHEDDRRTGIGYARVWMEGQDPETAEFIDVKYRVGYIVAPNE